MKPGWGQLDQGGCQFHCESFNSKLRDELLDGEIFFSLAGPWC